MSIPPTDLEWWCREKPLEHRQDFTLEDGTAFHSPYINSNKTCCGRTMAVNFKKLQPITECRKGNCTMALDEICRCYECEGKFHGTERWRHHYLVGTMDEYLIHRPLKVKFVIL